MNVVRDHIKYLKDNPEGYWFKRKLYGWGWTPATKQGWFLMLGYILLVLGVVVYVENNPGSLSGEQTAAALVLVTVLFLAIVWRTGEPPRWQWGKDLSE
tara:strand:- start:40395 stop:40691 length:297 start_codon:yes stop_codon:yes gene_type:complete